MSDTPEIIDASQRPVVIAPHPQAIAAKHDAFPKIPAKIALELAKIRKEVKTVIYNAENQFDKYNYTSVDAIYAACHKFFENSDLVVLPIELEDVKTETVSTKNGPKLYGRFVIGFVLVLNDEQFFDPRVRETLFVPITGAQTFQAAKSYAQKSWYRQTFKIPTGDKDLDADEQEKDDTTDGSAKKAAKKKAPTEDDIKTSKYSADNLVSIINAVAVWPPDVRENFVNKYQATINGLLPSDAQRVRSAYAEAIKKPGGK